MNILKINLTELRTNPKNIYEEQSIIELAENIQQFGQLENGTVYCDEQKDGKKYTLVGGHRRFLAINYLAERGLHEPTMLVNVIDRPVEITEEEMLILADNQQRIKDKETKIKEVYLLNQRWNYLKSIGKKPQGKKRDWIAKNSGYCARTIQDILTEIKNNAERNGANNSNVSRNTRSNRNDLTLNEVASISLRRAIKNIEKVNSLQTYSECNLTYDDKLFLSEVVDNLKGIMERLGN